MIPYGFKKTLSKSFDEVEENTRKALSTEGFGVLTRIDLQDKLKEKLGVDFKKYIILGACSPANAYAAVQAEEDIGLMLPCNVVLYETDSGTTVSIVKPSIAMSMIENNKLESIAEEVENKLQRAFDEII